MRIRRLRKRIKRYLFERVAFSVIPHSRGKIREIELPRFVFIIIFMCFLGYVAVVTYLFRDYLAKYNTTKEEILALQQVKTQNMTLRAGLVQVAKETEKMRKIISELENKGKNIEALISETGAVNVSTKEKNNNDFIIFNYKLLENSSNVPLGGGNEYLKTDSFELLAQIREELRMLKIELPLHENNINELHADVENYKDLMAATPNGWPLIDEGKGYISSEFGFRSDPLTDEIAFHEGLDIGVWYGTPVIATADGKVTYADWMGSYGRIVIIDHDFGYETRYAHNSKLVVQSGQHVKRGDIIAYSGNTGKSTGPHLHYEVRYNGVPKDPTKFLK